MTQTLIFHLINNLTSFLIYYFLKLFYYYIVQYINTLQFLNCTSLLMKNDFCISTPIIASGSDYSIFVLT
jgi:hypothetical protein